MDKDMLIELGIEESVADTLMAEVDGMRAAYEEEIQKIRTDFEIDSILREKGARNIKAVRALLTEGDASQVASQIDKLIKDKETRFLFEAEKKGFEPYQSGQTLPDVVKNDYEERLNRARKNHNSIEAIRIKQQAASEGIMLI